MYRTVQAFNEPHFILQQLNEDKAEMSASEHGFLCGLLKEKSPRKILEVGVAAGGTTAVMLNCISMLNLDCDFYSVDLNNYYYRNPQKEIGYLIEEAKAIIGNKNNHTLFSGDTIAKYIDEIGNNIDFLIIDTVHSLPGEVLDFLVCYPFLSKDAVVVLHDITLNYHGKYQQSYATKLLFDVVTATKFINISDEISNIAAFQINDDTSKYIEDCFSCLTITWNYIPSEVMLEGYRKVIMQLYDYTFVKLFDQGVIINKTIREKQLSKRDRFMKELGTVINYIKNTNHIMLYGIGSRGKRLYSFLKYQGIEVEGFVVSDGQEKQKEYYDNVLINAFSEIKYSFDEYTIILATSFNEVKEMLEEKNIKYIELPDEIWDGLALFNIQYEYN